MIKNVSYKDIMKFGYKNSDNPFIEYLGYFKDSLLVGYLVYEKIYEKVDIDYIYVLEEFRNCKIATSMLEYLINVCIEEKKYNITLEVNEKNYNAIKLYEKFDFRVVAKRKNYYKNEDGLLMERVL